MQPSAPFFITLESGNAITFDVPNISHATPDGKRGRERRYVRTCRHRQDIKRRTSRRRLQLIVRGVTKRNYIR